MLVQKGRLLEQGKRTDFQSSLYAKDEGTVFSDDPGIFSCQSTWRICAAFYCIFKDIK
jgi:hypothetical protein